MNDLSKTHPNSHRQADFLSSKAERANNTRVTVHFLLMIVIILESFHLIPLHAGTIAILIATIGSVAAIIHQNKTHHQHRGIKLKLMIEDAFGVSLENPQSFLDEANSYSLPHGYFSSELEPGFKRLQAHLTETIFFTGQLYKIMLRSTTIILLLPATLVLITAMIGPLIESIDLIHAERVLVLLVVFMNEAHILVECFELSTADRECKQLLLEIQQKDLINHSAIPHMMFILTRYQMIAVVTPYPPLCLYKKHRDRLNALWSQYSAFHEVGN